MGKVVGLGEALWDMLPEGKQIGGAPANFAYHAMLFCHEATVVSAVGEDALGKELTARLRAKQLNLEIPTVDHPTGTVEIQLSEEGIPRYEILREVAWDYIPFTEGMASLAAQTDAVCFGSLAQRHITSRRSIQRFIDAMPNQGRIHKVFDINLRQCFYDRALLADSFQRATTVKLNDEELPIVTQLFGLKGENPEEQCRQLMELFTLRMVILTCGTKGSYVFADTQSSFLDTPKVCVADTVGAGDAFTGAFIGALLNGQSLREAHAIAVRHSAFVCTQAGAMPPIPISSRY